MYEKQLGTIQAQTFNLDQTKFATESLQDNMKMVSAMKDANKAMKVQMKQVNID